MGWGGVVPVPFGSAPPRMFFTFGCRNAYFGAFSGPSECLLLHRMGPIYTSIQVVHQTFSIRLPSPTLLTVAQSKALEFLQKRAWNIIFPGSE